MTMTTVVLVCLAVICLFGNRVALYWHMPPRVHRPPPDLSTSTLVHYGGSTFVDADTGMVLSRVGWVGTGGYELVYIEGRQVYAHRLIYEALEAPITDGLTINHMDGDKANNHPSNLEVATMGEQLSHAYRTGLRVGNGRTRQVSDAQVQQMMDAKRGEIQDVAAACGVSRAYAYQIRMRERRRRGMSRVTAWG